MAKLYELSTGYKNIEYLLGNGEDSEELAAVLNSFGEEIEDKAENIAKLIKNYESDIEAFKTEEKRIAERRRTLENDVKRLKEYLYNNMKLTGKTKFKRGTFSFNIAKNPPSVEIVNQDIISSDYKTYTEVLNKKAILQDLKIAPCTSFPSLRSCNIAFLSKTSVYVL